MRADRSRGRATDRTRQERAGATPDDSGDQSWLGGRAQMIGFASIPGVCLALLMIFGLYIQDAHSQTAARSASIPKTISQCQRKFGRRPKARAACVRRVRSEKPGSSCAHPLYSSLAAAGPSGDTKDVQLKFKTIHQPLNPGSSEPGTFEVEVINLNPRAVDCSLIVSEFPESTTMPGKIERGKVFHLAIGPGGGTSSPVTTPSDVVTVPLVHFWLK
jgi:hypothetical protein